MLGSVIGPYVSVMAKLPSISPRPFVVATALSIMTLAVPALAYKTDRSRKNLAGKNLSKQELFSVTFRSSNLAGANLTKTLMDEVTFEGANLQRSRFNGAKVVTFRIIKLRRGNRTLTKRIKGRPVNFKGADGRLTHFNDVNLPSSNFEGARLHSARFMRARLAKSRFRGADLAHALLERADLSQCNFYGATLAHAKLQEANLRGANLYGANLNSALLRRADLRGASLVGADLRGANLCRVTCDGTTNISGAKTRGAKCESTFKKQCG